jgi:NDP-sugar pyrophosphorylase family protein
MKKNKIAIVFAAGKGSRMSPLTNTIPKPLARVKDKTLLEINLERLADLVDSYIIVVSYLKEQIQDYLGFSFLGKPVYYAVQDNPKGGTLDAFRTALNFIEKKPEIISKNSGYLVSGSDDILGFEFYQTLDEKIRQNPDITYLIAKKIEDRELLKSKGVFRINENNQLIEIIEKPQDFVSKLTNIGLYYLPSQISDFIKTNFPPRILNSDQEEYITDMFNLYAKQKPVEVVPSEANYFSISTLLDLKKANEKGLD